MDALKPLSLTSLPPFHPCPASHPLPQIYLLVIFTAFEAKLVARFPSARWLSNANGNAAQPRPSRLLLLLVR